jgi:hypothetical protein
MHRVAWDLRYPASTPVTEERELDPWDLPPSGPMAAPGDYTVELTQVVDGEQLTLGERQRFAAVPLGHETLAAEDRKALLDFQQRVGRLQRAVMGTVELTRERAHQLELMRTAALGAANGEPMLDGPISELRSRLDELEDALHGDRTVARRSEPTAPGILQRVDRAVGAFWSSSAPTATHRRDYEIASSSFGELLEDLQRFESDFAELQEVLEAAGAPWTSGRSLPDWQPE